MIFQARRHSRGRGVGVAALETSVNGLYRMLADLTGFSGEPGHGPAPPGELRRCALDNSQAAEALGWRPWTHLEDGLGETVAFMKGV